jgi:DNA-directed RNA polymerase subunit RPC12/RpoP
MPLVSAKCTECGAIVELDNTKKAGICTHCGNAFIVEEAVNIFNNANFNVNVDKVVVNENLELKNKINTISREILRKIEIARRQIGIFHSLEKVRSDKFNSKLNKLTIEAEISQRTPIYTKEELVNITVLSKVADNFILEIQAEIDRLKKYKMLKYVFTGAGVLIIIILAITVINWIGNLFK